MTPADLAPHEFASRHYASLKVGDEWIAQLAIEIAARDAAVWRAATEAQREAIAQAFIDYVPGGWPDDTEDTPKEWEEWTLMLYGEEAGDTMDGHEGRRHFLRLFALVPPPTGGGS